MHAHSSRTAQPPAANAQDAACSPAHPSVKKIIRNFKLKRSLVDFFFEHKGRNISKMFELAEINNEFRDEVVNSFLFNHTPSKEFLLKIKY